MSRSVANLYDEFHPMATLNILLVANFWRSFDVRHWQDLLVKMENDYAQFDFASKVGLRPDVTGSGCSS